MRVKHASRQLMTLPDQIAERIFTAIANGEWAAGERILGSTERMLRMVSQLLDVTRSRLGGGMPIETYIMAARALTCPVPPRRVVISLGAPHFATPDLFWERSVKFGFVTSNDLALLRRLSRETGDAALEAPKAPDGLPSALRGWLYEWRFPSLYFSSLVKGRGFLRLWHNEATFAMTLAARGQAFFGLDAGSSSVA